MTEYKDNKIENHSMENYNKENRNIKKDNTDNHTELYQIRNGVLEAYTGREEVAYVPSGIHTIGTGAFKACISLKKIILPPGLQEIGENAFKGCRKLEEITIPEGVTEIGAYAFHRCHALRQIVLPRSVEKVGDCAFLYCDHLVCARLPGVKRLGAQLFLNDVWLERLEVSPDLEVESICDIFTGCSRVTEIALAGGACIRIPNAVEAAAGDQELPPLVRQIVTDILRMMELDGRTLVRFLINLKQVDIPEGIQRLAKSCFFDKRGIMSVTLPRSLQEIESRAFRNCISLERVVFQGEQIQIREDAFRNCTSLKTIQLGDGSEYQLSGLSGVRKLPAKEESRQKERLVAEPEGKIALKEQVPEKENIPDIVRLIQRQVLGSFRISGTLLLKYLGSESRVIVPEGITRIGAEAFARNEAIDRVILPESLIEIGAEAFRDCLLLQTVSFPERLCRIGAGAFEHCVKLLRAVLPAGITEIEERTFRHCPVLQEVSLPEGLQRIGEGAFYSCISLKKVLFPESLTRIGELAFYRCTGLREVRLPAGVREVKSLAFAKSGVKRAWIAGNGRDFGTDVFGSCERLKLLVLEEGVRHIPDKLAYGCTALERVMLPETLESVGRHVWEESVFLEQWREKARKSDATGLQTERKEGLEGAVFWDGREQEGVVELPEGVRIIAGGAFYGNKKVTEIRIPESVRFIGKSAFQGCSALQRLVLPAGIKELEPELCSGCTSLEEVVTTGKETEKPAFTLIGERAFYQCKRLSVLSLEQTEYIGKEALSGCLSLKWSTISSRLTVGERAFEGTRYVTSPGVVVIGSVVAAGTSCNGTVILPEGITKIAPYAFAGNRRLTKISLPESIEELGEGVFFGCSNLSEVIFPEERLRQKKQAERDSTRPYRIGARAFEKCCSLTEIETTAEQIGTAAFAFCTALKHVVFSGISRVSDRLLEGCVALETCVCKGAETVGQRSFCGCEALEYFPFETVRELGGYAFEGCDSLRKVSFQNPVFLAAYALKDCGRLSRMELLHPELSLQEYALSGCTGLEVVCCEGRDWHFSGYQDICSEVFPEAVRRLFDSAFSCFEVEQEERLYAYHGSGKIVRIPEGIRRIEAEVFRNCMQLREVVFPDSLEYIGARAFHGTAWIEQQKGREQKEQQQKERQKWQDRNFVLLQNKLKTEVQSQEERNKEWNQAQMVVIKDMLLDASGCMGEVSIPAELRQVCGWAFANALGLHKIRFCSDRTRVGEYAFRNCVFLEEMELPDGQVIKLTGLKDRERELPPLAKQVVMDSLNCFKTDENGVLVICTGNISVLRLPSGITAIGEGAFQDGNLLTNVLFSDTIQAIGRRAFAGCKWLEEVCQAEGVRTIEAQAFSGCGRLRRVELSDHLEQIGARAFENCTSLEEIRIPEGVVEIPEKAFYRCHSLKHISLPSTIKQIGKDAFAFCGVNPV